MVVEGSMSSDTETFLIFHLEWADMASMAVALRFVLCCVFFYIYFNVVLLMKRQQLVMRVRKKGKEIRMIFRQRTCFSFGLQSKKMVTSVRRKC